MINLENLTPIVHFATRGPTVMGIPLLNFIIGIVVIVVLVGAIGGWIFKLMYDRKQREKNQLATVGHVVGEFLPENGGTARFLLVETFKGEARKIEENNRVLFTRLFAKPPSEIEGQNIDSYLLMPEHDWDIWWPIGKPKAQQVSMKMYKWIVNDPIPKIPHDAKKWDEDRYFIVSSSMYHNAKEESVTNIIVSKQSQNWKDIRDLVRYAKGLPFMKILQFVTIGGLLIVAFIGVQSMNKGDATNKLLNQYIKAQQAAGFIIPDNSVK